MHCHSLLWFAALLVVVAAVYRRFLAPPVVGGVALLLFAIDDAHSPTVGWVANRNLIMALCLSLPALLLHDRFRRQREERRAWAAAVSLAAGLCASEAGLVTCAYLVAYAAVLDRGPWHERFGSLWRYAAVVLLWRGLYGWLGYGVHGSGLYVDPVASPLSFLAAATERLPVLLLAQLAAPWADLWEVYPLVAPALRTAVFALACTLIIAAYALLRRYWAQSETLRFWTLGGFLALLPMCGTFPHDRLLLAPGVAGMAVVAELLCLACLQRRWGVAAPLVAIHLLLAPLLAPLRAFHVDDLDRSISRAEQSLPADDGVRQKTIVLINPPLDPFAAYLPIYRAASGRPQPRSLLWLATGVTELTLTRADSRTLRVRARDGFLSSTSQLMLRDPRRPPRLGDVITLEAARITVKAALPDGRPLEIEVQFREPLESPELSWFEWRGQEYAPFAPPAFDQPRIVPAVDLVRTLFSGLRSWREPTRSLP
jgi:hypothetical protein